MANGARVYSINISGIREVPFFGQTIKTGIFKEPVTGPVTARQLGLIGDAQADLTVHGGLQKAVYFYPREHYAAWKSLLGVDRLPPGSFGENITCEGLTETDLYVGDILKIGTASLQVIQPRSPCFKLQMKFDRQDMIAQFVKMARPGWYASVIEPGTFAAGDTITLQLRPAERISIAEIWRYSLIADADEETKERVGRLSLLPDFWKQRITSTA